MSEYQYYEFQAIDRPLTQREMGELRSCSSRATITATRFVNSYSFGNFKGNPSQWMAWLLCAQAGDLDEADEEPPCPPGFGKLTAPLEAFVDFLRVDRDLIAVAAARSPDATCAATHAEIESWVKELPESERTGLLVRLMEGTEVHLREELLRRFRDSRNVASRASADRARTTGELLKAAEQCA